MPRCVDHLRGRPVLVTTISVSLLLTTCLRVAVQESPLLSVTMMGVPGSWSLSGSWATGSPSSTAPQPLVELAGLPTLDRRLVRVGLQVVVGLGRRVWRFGPGGVVGVVGLKVGELLFEALLDQSSQPGGDVDGFLLSESVDTAPHLGVDTEADGGLYRHAVILL